MVNYWSSNNTGGHFEKNKNKYLWIAIAICCIACVVLFILSWALKSWRCTIWTGLGIGPEKLNCLEETNTPSLMSTAVIEDPEYDVPLVDIADYNDNCKAKKEPDPNFGGFNGKPWSDNTKRATTTPNNRTISNGSGTSYYVSDGCGWCGTMHYRDGRCYESQSATTPGGMRPRVFVKNQWEWCDLDGKNAQGADKYKDNARTKADGGEPCALLTTVNQSSGSGGSSPVTARRVLRQKRSSSRAMLLLRPKSRSRSKSRARTSAKASKQRRRRKSGTKSSARRVRRRQR